MHFEWSARSYRSFRSIVTQPQNGQLPFHSAGLTATAIRLSPPQGKALSARLSSGMLICNSFSCARENVLRRNIFPLNHHPGTENLLKSKILSISKPARSRPSCNVFRVYRSRCSNARSSVPYNTGCCGTRMTARPPGIREDRRFRRATCSSGTCSSTFTINAVSNFSSRPAK